MSISATPTAACSTRARNRPSLSRSDISVFLSFGKKLRVDNRPGNLIAHPFNQSYILIRIGMWFKGSQKQRPYDLPF